MLVDDLHHWVTYYRYVPERTAQGCPGMKGLSPWWKLLRVKPGGPAIPAHASLRRPDLIFHQKDRPTYLLDVTVVADKGVLRDAHCAKSNIMMCQMSEIGLRETSSATRLSFPVWRSLGGGGWPLHRPTPCTQPWILGRQTLSLLSAITCERSLWIWQHFHRSNFRVPEWLAH